jgi:hypothetical protein
MAVKFGRSQLKNPTPTIVGSIVQVTNIVASSVIVWITTVTFINAKWSSIIQGIFGLILLITNGLKPLFGVPNDGKDVPVEDVAEMNEKKTE